MQERHTGTHNEQRKLTIIQHSHMIGLTPTPQNAIASKGLCRLCTSWKLCPPLFPHMGAMESWPSTVRGQERTKGSSRGSVLGRACPAKGQPQSYRSQHRRIGLWLTKSHKKKNYGTVASRVKRALRLPWGCLFRCKNCKSS